MKTEVISIRVRVESVRHRLAAVESCLETCFTDDNVVGQGCLEILCDIVDDLETLETSVAQLSEIPEIPEISESKGNGKGNVILLREVA